MPQDPQRRLAAIMFADVAGYTAMMQRNEKEGLVKVQRFNKVMEAEVKTYQGDILEFRGDGCMVVFDSAVQAMHAAKAIQEQLQQAPTVPLRIGIHIGDIVFTNGNIYGDGVNLASRVESMGVPGSVLVTERIIHDVKSHPEFEMTSLGKFQFKNVAKPMEVFALTNEGFVVPKPEEMKGKGEKIKAKNPAVFLVGIGVFAIVVGVILFGAFSNQITGKNQLLPENIREAKVAVSVLDNFTGDENLDALGYMASEWISAGLRELKVHTVSPEMVRQYKDAIGILPSNSDNQPAFSEITGADYIVSGSYFLKKDSIVLHTRLISALNGEEIVNFPDLIVNQNEKEKLVQEARQYIMGYWATRNEQELAQITPPRYQAYQIYLKCLSNPANAQCFEEVLEEDPNFIMARILRMGACSMNSNDSIFYLNHAVVKKNWNKTTIYEKFWFDASYHFYQGNYEATQEAWEEAYLLDSKDLYTIYFVGFAALLPFNQAHYASRRFAEIFDNIHLYEDKIDLSGYYHYIDALIRIGEFQKASDFYLNLPENTKANIGNHPARYAMAALIYQNRIKETLALIEKRGGHSYEYLQVAFMYQFIHPESVNPFKVALEGKINQFKDECTLNWEGIRLFDWRTKASTYYVLREWEQAKEALLKMQTPKKFKRTQPYDTFPENAYWEKLWHTAMLGCVFARLGEMEKAETQIKQLDALGQLYPTTNAAFLRGTYPYLKARIYAELGEKKLAVAYLNESIHQGRFFGYMSFTMDMFLVNLKGYEPFEKLIQTKG